MPEGDSQTPLEEINYRFLLLPSPPEAFTAWVEDVSGTIGKRWGSSRWRYLAPGRAEALLWEARRRPYFSGFSKEKPNKRGSSPMAAAERM